MPEWYPHMRSSAIRPTVPPILPTITIPSMTPIREGDQSMLANEKKEMPK